MERQTDGNHAAPEVEAPCDDGNEEWPGDGQQEWPAKEEVEEQDTGQLPPTVEQEFVEVEEEQLPESWNPSEKRSDWQGQEADDQYPWWAFRQKKENHDEAGRRSNAGKLDRWGGYYNMDGYYVDPSGKQWQHLEVCLRCFLEFSLHCKATSFKMSVLFVGLTEICY